MKTEIIVKRPDDRLDYDVKFCKWLEGNDTLTGATVTVDSASGVVVDDYSFDETKVKVWLTGGTEGKTARVTVEGTTELGRTKEICFRVRIRSCC